LANDQRLFVAIDLPESTRQLLASVDPQIRGVRWIEPTQMHLTLAFFGDVEDDIELALREKLGAIDFGAFFLPSSVSERSLQKALLKLFGSVSARRTHIYSKSTSACRKPRSPLG